ncbi:hypothetical protein R1flu_002475 [Riccia fluitans]|uniref:Uncharacterized protein n=1 Tax=Riccia fluitans TaxID=41844 RepID=A0ABD1Y6E2_9MARC
MYKTVKRLSNRNGGLEFPADYETGNHYENQCAFLPISEMARMFLVISEKTAVIQRNRLRLELKSMGTIKKNSGRLEQRTGIDNNKNDQLKSQRTDQLESKQKKLRLSKITVQKSPSALAEAGKQKFLPAYESRLADSSNGPKYLIF